MDWDSRLGGGRLFLGRRVRDEQPNDDARCRQGGPPMRILMVTSFPVPGEYDGTAMLPIKILRALKARGVEVVLAHLKARPPWGRSERGDFEGTPSFTFSPAGLGRRPPADRAASSRSTWSTPSITAAPTRRTWPAGWADGRWSMRSTRSWATRSSATGSAGGRRSGSRRPSSATSASTRRPSSCWASRSRTSSSRRRGCRPTGSR